MGYSKREKARFFESVDHIVDLCKDYAKGHNCSYETAISDLDFPCKYGEVKWALKKLQGEFPNKETILKLCHTKEQIDAFNSEWHRSMSDYR